MQKTSKQKKRNLKEKLKGRSEIGKVVHFNENLGIGIIKLSDGSRIKVTYRMIEGEGLRMLFEGEKVLITEDGKIRRLEDETDF